MSSRADSEGERARSARPLGAAVLGVERFLAVALLVMIVVLTFAQVVARFVFNSPFFWTEELARHSYVWLSFVAAVAVMANRTHLTVELLDGKMSRLARLVANCIGMIAVIVACVMIGVGSLESLQERSGGKSPALGIPTLWLYGVVYLAFIAMALHALVNIAHLIAEFRRGDEPDERQPSTEVVL